MRSSVSGLKSVKLKINNFYEYSFEYLNLICDIQTHSTNEVKTWQTKMF